MRFVVPNMGEMSQDWPRDSQFPGSSSLCTWGANEERIREPEEANFAPLGLSGGPGQLEGHLVMPYFCN
jgi:hypothetical protein